MKESQLLDHTVKTITNTGGRKGEDHLSAAQAVTRLLNDFRQHPISAITSIEDTLVTYRYEQDGSESVVTMSGTERTLFLVKKLANVLSKKRQSSDEISALLTEYLQTE